MWTDSHVGLIVQSFSVEVMNIQRLTAVSDSLPVSVFRSVLRGTSPVGRQHVWNISAKPAVSRSVRVFVQCSCVRSRFPVLPSSKYTICSRMCSSLLASFLQVLTEPISKWRDVRGHNPLVTYTCRQCAELEGFFQNVLCFYDAGVLNTPLLPQASGQPYQMLWECVECWLVV